MKLTLLQTSWEPSCDVLGFKSSCFGGFEKLCCLAKAGAGQVIQHLPNCARLRSLIGLPVSPSGTFCQANNFYVYVLTFTHEEPLPLYLGAAGQKGLKFPDYAPILGWMLYFYQRQITVQHGTWCCAGVVLGAACSSAGEQQELCPDTVPLARSACLLQRHLSLHTHSTVQHTQRNF